MELINDDTFSFQTDGPAVAAQSAQAAQQSLDSIGSGVQNNTRAQSIPEQGDMGVLFKLGAKLLEPRVKKEQEAKFFEGMARAAAGEAAKDIAEGRSFVEELYGSNHVELGARAYEAEADAANLMGKVYEQLPALSQMPTQQASQEIRKLVDLHKPVGDPMRSQMYEAQAIKEVPGILRAQAKGYAGYLQDKANTAHALRTVALFDKYEGASKSATSDEERALAEVAVAEVLVTMPGQNPENAMKNVAQAVVAQARAGKFAGYNWMTKAGVLKTLPPQMAAELENAVSAEAAQLAPRSMTPEEDLALFALKQDYTKSPSELRTALDKFNEDFRTRSGIPGDAFPRQYYQSLYGMHANERDQRTAAEARERGRVSAAQAKAFEEQQEQARIIGAAQGSFDAIMSGKRTGRYRETMDNLPDAAKKLLKNSLNLEWTRANPVQRAQLLDRATDAFEPFVKEAVEHLSHSEAVFSGDVASTVATVAAVPNWQNRLGLGPKQIALIETFNNAAQPGADGKPPNFDAAWTAARTAAMTKAALVNTTKEDRDLISKAIDKDDQFAPGFMSRWFNGADPVSNASRSLLEAVALNELKTIGGYDGQTRSDVAVRQAKDRVELYGPIAILKTNKNAGSLKNWIGRKGNKTDLPTEGYMARAVIETFNAKTFFGKEKADPGEWTFVRAEDTTDGMPVYQAWTSSREGIVTITGDDILKTLRAYDSKPGGTDDSKQRRAVLDNIRQQTKQ